MARLVLVSHADDARLAALVLLLRKERGWTQRHLAQLAAAPRVDLMLIEAGGAGDVKLARTRRVLEELGGRARLTTWYNGAAADRLLDRRHASIAESAIGLFVRRGWLAAAEVTFSDYGERGSIDILAGHAPTRTVAVCEVKSAIGSIEETNRVLDVNERLAPKLVYSRFGWWPAAVARLLILPDEMTARRVVEQHAYTMASLYPARGREIRTWLRKPEGPLRGIWFSLGSRPARPDLRLIAATSLTVRHWRQLRQSGRRRRIRGRH